MVVLPLYEIIAVPDANLYLQTDVYRTLTGEDPVKQDDVTVIIPKDKISKDDIQNDIFHSIGLCGYVKEINAQGYLVIRLTQRLDLEDVELTEDKKISLASCTRPDIEDMDQQDAQKRIASLKDEFRILSESFEWGPMMRMIIASWHTLGDMAAVLSPWMNFSHERYYALLEEDSQQKRFDALEIMLYEYIEVIRVQIKVHTDQHESRQRIYREQAIRNQLTYLQKELDEMHPEEISGIHSLEIKLQAAGLNEMAEKEAAKLLRRLKAEGEHSHEAGGITDYLEFLASLPWKRAAAQPISLDGAEEILDADHFGLDKVKKRILEQLAVMQLKKKQSGSILLFVGAPGTGKTSIGQSIAKALGRAYVRISLGGVRDEADIRGHRRTYVGAMPGRIMDGIHKCGASNPVMVLDEVDKLSVSYNGDPASALLEVLDPEQNHTFTDHYLNVPFDLSDVFFVCTANTTDTIPEPLLNRMEVIHFQGYTPLEKQEIAMRHLLPKAMEATGLQKDDLTITPESIARVISEYTREAGVRGLKKRIDALCRNAAVRMVRGEAAPIEVHPEHLREYLDMSPIRQKQMQDDTIPGVVTGLAWTQAGGDVLFIETRKMKGTGKLVITGQLGDVMKESAQIALSLVRSIYPEQAAALAQEDIHIHVPDGATPKDGPSAGITLTTALASLLCGKPVSPTVAMTGEVSLQGAVNPIGGLPEKLLAAQRSGVKTVFIPADNEDDLCDVAQEVKEQLMIIPVREVNEVLRTLSLVPEVKRPRKRSSASKKVQNEGESNE